MNSKMTETIQQLKEDIAILQEKLRKLEELQRTKSPAEEAFKKVYHRYPDKLDDKYGSAWDIFEKGYNAAQEPEKEQKWDVVRESVKWCEEHPNESVEDYLKPQTPEQVADGLKEAFREAVKQGIVSSVDKPKPMNEVLDRLENKYENDVSENKQKPKTLYDILYRWWMDIFCNPIYRDWDMETSIEDLVDRIEFWNMRIKNDDEVELDEQENDKNFKNSLDLIREWGEKNKPPTLTELLWEWWDEDWGDTKDKCIDMLVDIIGEKFIPPSNDTNGYEWEKCLKMMRGKLR
jgi:hypothetical protein